LFASTLRSLPKQACWAPESGFSHCQAAPTTPAHLPPSFCRDFKAQFALRPQHSDDASQQLVFRMLRDNRLVLVPTDFSGTLQREVETFIERFRSIPAFTANLTMEYFQKQTQC
jgi:hypothetical protein